MSHSLGEFFLLFFLPSFFSIKLHILNNFKGDKIVVASMTILLNFGFDLSGQDSVSK